MNTEKIEERLKQCELDIKETAQIFVLILKALDDIDKKICSLEAERYIGKPMS